ncbi:hypothetical protein QF032_003540 [Streptomyces achromogenes]|nr:hypothetical protein [Streptomyces achromogenes]
MGARWAETGKRRNADNRGKLRRSAEKQREPRRNSEKRGNAGAVRTARGPEGSEGASTAHARDADVVHMAASYERKHAARVLRDGKTVRGGDHTPKESRERGRRAPSRSERSVNAGDPRVWSSPRRGRPDVPATRGSGDCVGLAGCVHRAHAGPAPNRVRRRAASPQSPLPSGIHTSAEPPPFRSAATLRSPPGGLNPFSGTTATARATVPVGGRNGRACGSCPEVTGRRCDDSPAILRESYVGCVTFQLNEGK